MFFFLYVSLTSTFAQRKVDQIIDRLRNPDDNSVLVAAHRGDWFWAPENSLAAFQNCIEAGVDIIELDVRLSKDGVPVVIHDLTLDRTTTGKGHVKDYTLTELKSFFLKDAVAVVTKAQIPTLEEVLTLCKDRILVYLDKSYNKVPQILAVLRNTGTLHQAMFVLDFPYAKAKRVFGTALDSVLFVPVIGDHMDHLSTYVKDYESNMEPVAYQFRMAKTDGPAYPILEEVVQSKPKAFVAATWPQHTIGHDDQRSRTNPDEGWGWLIHQGFQIIETNRPYQLLAYLRSKKLHP